MERTTPKTPLIDDLHARLDALSERIKGITRRILAGRVNSAANELFDVAEWPPGGKRQRRARVLYHRLVGFRDRLVRLPGAADADELKLAREHIDTLVDGARELMAGNDVRFVEDSQG